MRLNEPVTQREYVLGTDVQKGKGSERPLNSPRPPLWQTHPLRLKPGRWSPLGHAKNHRADRARDPG